MPDQMEQELLGACEGLPVVEVAAGETLMTQGDVSKRLYVLIEGTVDVMRGPTRVTRIHMPGALFGEMSQLLGHPYSASVVAVTPARFYLVENGPAFLGSSPAVALYAARNLAQRLYDATTYLVDIKRQFEDKHSHLGMLDVVLGSLLHQPHRSEVRMAEMIENPDDPRLGPRLG